MNTLSILLYDIKASFMFELKTSHRDSNMFENLDNDLIISHLSRRQFPIPTRSPSPPKKIHPRNNRLQFHCR
jgi:hypothetical protein